MKCYQYLSCNVSKHRRSHSPTTSKKNLSRPLARNRSLDVILLMSQKLQENGFLLKLVEIPPKSQFPFFNIGINGGLQCLVILFNSANLMPSFISIYHSSIKKQLTK